MAKKETIELGTKLRQSELYGIFDLNENEEDVVIVNGETYLFDDIKKYFHGGTIQISNVSFEE